MTSFNQAKPFACSGFDTQPDRLQFIQRAKRTLSSLKPTELAASYARAMLPGRYNL